MGFTLTVCGILFGLALRADRCLSSHVSATAFYSAQLDVIDAHLEANKARLLKNLKEVVTLSKWELTNCWSLTESTIKSKSHLKLTKIARDFEALLTVSTTFVGVRKCLHLSFVSNNTQLR